VATAPEDLLSLAPPPPGRTSASCGPTSRARPEDQRAALDH